ncbi:hypothetical protein NHX12_028277 [Muraenolepis orangiensis]|uniref:Uncharacterized protein n=1 Tax=Muraenolepis orangiensis TaxID=630683 RepID=A0A9Q0E973_9TELE|nr:hypothetical protein NHX12_028277 [Muraenolepis orangiensis]
MSHPLYLLSYPHARLTLSITRLTDHDVMEGRRRGDDSLSFSPAEEVMLAEEDKNAEDKSPMDGAWYKRKNNNSVLKRSKKSKNELINAEEGEDHFTDISSVGEDTYTYPPPRITHLRPPGRLPPSTPHHPHLPAPTRSATAPDAPPPHASILLQGLPPLPPPTPKHPPPLTNHHHTSTTTSTFWVVTYGTVRQKERRTATQTLRTDRRQRAG